MTAARSTLQPQRFRLDNGLTVLCQPNAASTAVSISLRVAAGAAFETAPTAGRSGFCAAMLKRGTEQRSKAQIGEHLDFTGALLSAGSSRHTADIGAKAREADFESTLGLLAECAIMPSFPGAEVEKLRGDLLTAIREDRDDTRQLVTDALRAGAYPADHPYSWRLLGTEASIGALGRDDLVAFHRRHFDPGAAVLVVVGGVDNERVREAVEASFGGWESAADGNTGGLPAALPAIDDAAGPTGIERAVDTLADKSQADVGIGFPGLRRSDDDYYAAVVMNMILGSFAMGGRLGRVIREEKGMAYYVYSSLGASVGPGLFMIRAGVHPANVDIAVECAQEEMRRIQREPVTDDELSDAKSAIVRSLPRNLENNEGIAASLHSIEQFELGLDYLDRFPGLIESITAEEVQTVAASRLRPDACVVAVAGPYPLPAEEAEPDVAASDATVTDAAATSSSSAAGEE